MAAVHQQFNRTLLRKVHLIKIKSLFFSIWPGFSESHIHVPKCCLSSKRHVLQNKKHQEPAVSPMWAQPCRQLWLLCVDMGLLFSGAFCRARLCSAALQDGISYIFLWGSFSFEGKLVFANRSKSLHPCYSKWHCSLFSCRKTVFLLNDNITLSKYELSIPFTCQKLYNELRQQSSFWN